MGDVEGGPAFTHDSYDDYFVIHDNLANGKKPDYRTSSHPYAPYTDSELGRVGLTEREAKVQGCRLELGNVPMAHVARSLAT